MIAFCTATTAGPDSPNFGCPGAVLAVVLATTVAAETGEVIPGRAVAPRMLRTAVTATLLMRVL
jgi:hypothetical protein